MNREDTKTEDPGELGSFERAEYWGKKEAAEAALEKEQQFEARAKEIIREEIKRAYAAIKEQWEKDLYSGKPGATPKVKFVKDEEEK